MENPSNNRIRLFIVDDHYALRVGLVFMLQKASDIEVVAMAGSAAEAIDLLRNPTAFDVLLTDLRMQGCNGDEMVRQMRQYHEDLRVVFLTNYHSDEDIFCAVRAGAMGYLLKTASKTQILEAIRSVHGGGSYFPPNIAQQLAQRLARAELTEREAEVLRLAGRGLLNREIGDELNISESTVKNHMLSLMKKLGTTHRTEAIAIASHRGLIRLRNEEEG